MQPSIKRESWAGSFEPLGSVGAPYFFKYCRMSFQRYSSALAVTGAFCIGRASAVMCL